MSTFVPAEVFPPGYFIQWELESRDWTQEDLAQIMGRPLQAINEIIKAKKKVTEETAKELELALGIDADWWLRTEALYRLHHDSKPAPKVISKRAALRRRAPVRHILNRHWIEPTDDHDELERRVMRFLSIESLEDKPRFAAAARQTVYGEPATPIQEAWLARVRQLAKTIPASRYSNEKLEAAIEQFYPLLMSPDESRHVPQLLADAGVRFVVVEQIPGLKVQAVCTWLSATEPIIGMSLVRDSIDNFWFGVRHECQHVLNGDGKEGAVIDNDMDRPDETSEQERLANAAAARFCVDQEALRNFVERKITIPSDLEIRNFARIQKRHPGIVAGQLRRHLNAYDRYTSMLAHVRHVVVTTATVDGFGITPAIN